MLIAGQVPGSWSGEMPDVLAMLRTRFAPDGGGAGGEGGEGTGGSGDGSGVGAGTGGGDGQTGSDGQQFDAARAQRTIAQLREAEKAGKAAAKERDDLAARLKAIEDKDKTDSEKLASDLKSTTEKLTAAEKRAADAEAKFQQAQIRAAIDREAHKQGAVDADAVFALVDRSEITLDDDGNVSGADKAVAALLKAKTYLVGQATNGTGERKGPPGTPNPTGQGGHADRVKEHSETLQKTGLFAPL